MDEELNVKLVKGVVGVLGVLLAVAIFFGAFVGVKLIGPGEVGIRVNLAGGGRGVNATPVTTGWAWFFKPTQQIYKYPTFVQTYNWTQAKEEGSPTDESITFNSKEGLAINSDISVAFKLDPTKVPTLYSTYRQDIKTVMHTYIRNAVRQEFVNIASKMAVEEIYGEKKQWLAEEVTRELNTRLADVGFEIDYIAFSGNLRLPETVVQSVNAKIQATQKALQIENEVRSAEAEAKKKVAAAEGEAKSILVRAEAQAKANALQVQSLGGAENYVRLQAIEKLNPAVSVMMVPGGSSPFIGLDALTRK